MTPRVLLTALASAALVAGTAVAAAPAPPAAARTTGTTYVVTRTDDPVSTGACDSDCSLREAVIAANSDPNIDTIALHAGSTYVLSVVGPGDAQQGDLDITHSVDFTVTGGTSNATIDGNGLTTGDRVLQVVGGETQLHGVDIANGVAPSDGGSPAKHLGGGIAVSPAAALDLYDDHVFDNTASTAPGDMGGAIYNNGGRVFLSHVLMSSNQAGMGFGGAIETIGANAQTTILNSKLVRNEAAFGGALDDSGGSTAVENTQLGSNNAGTGGAIYGGFNGSGQTSLINVTANDNEASPAPAATGGVARIIGGTLYVKNSTLSNNRSTDGALSVQQLGGPAPGITLEDSIVAGNADTDPSDGTHPDCANPSGGLIHTNGYNLVGNADGCGIFKTTGDQLGSGLVPIDAGLVGTSPGANGGPQLTFAISPTSNARDAGDPGADGCEPVDARGIHRSLGGRCDIGAYELVTCGSATVDVVGTNQDDRGTFDSAATGGTDAFEGQGGDDAFRAGGGNDAACGDDGADLLVGGAGNDALYGGTGDDVLKGGPGNDHLVGGPGKHDVCVSGGGKDTAVGCEVKRGF